MVGSIGNNGAYYVRQAHFDNDRMAGSVAHWKNNANGATVSIQSLSLNDGDASVTQVKAPSANFGELLDVMNPLHHIPVVGNIYRNMTGDDISPVAKIIGGTIYGGGLGGLSAIANAAAQEHAGENDLASAVISSSKSDKIGYALIEDERSARMNRAQQPDKGVSDPIEVAILTTPQAKPISSSSSNNTALFEELEMEKRQPVTLVNIDVAINTVKKQQWNFNA